jgi:hypothetical protein
MVKNSQHLHDTQTFQEAVACLNRTYSPLHGRKSRGDGGTNPPEFAVGDAYTGCSPRFLSFFKISSARHGFVPPDFNPGLRHCPSHASSSYQVRIRSIPTLNACNAIARWARNCVKSLNNQPPCKRRLVGIKTDMHTAASGGSRQKAVDLACACGTKGQSRFPHIFPTSVTAEFAGLQIADETMHPRKA